MEPTPVIVKTCSNCGSTLVGKFCASCGQQDRPLDVSLPELAREVYVDVVELDGRFFASLRKLFFAPGFLTLEYFSGRRAAWLPPIRLYLIISVLYFAIGALTGNVDSNVDATVTGTSDQDSLDTLQNMGFENEAELEAAINAAEALWMPRVMFILMPILGLLVQMGQRTSGRRYPQHFIFAVHVQTAWFGLFALLEIVAHFTGSELARVFSGSRVHGSCTARGLSRQPPARSRPYDAGRPGILVFCDPAGVTDRVAHLSLAQNEGELRTIAGNIALCMQ
jgi:hypothetical protein